MEGVKKRCRATVEGEKASILFMPIPETEIGGVLLVLSDAKTSFFYKP